MKKIIIAITAILALGSGAFAQKHLTGQQIVKDQKTDPLYRNIEAANIRVNLKASEGDDDKITFIDNSNSKYFPKIVNQVGGSCAYASGIGYIYNYEYNALNDLDSKKPENIVNYLQVYSHLNDAEDHGGHAQLGWLFVKDNGAALLKDNGYTDIFGWASGYDKYYDGMQRDMVDYSYFDSGEDGGIEKMKQYLIDHGNGSKVGGLIQFSAFADPFDPTHYDGPHSEGSNYDAIIPKFGTEGMHSMTIVGFDDEVVYNYNGVDKKGAFICANSWGEDWGERQGCNSKGRFYAPYYAFSTLRQGNGGTGNGGKRCLIVTAKKAERTLTFKLNLSYTSRNDLYLEIGVANTPGAVSPEKKIALNSFMKQQGGDRYMKGGGFSSNKKLEVGINATALLQYVTSKTPTYFLRVKKRTQGNDGKGSVISCSLLDYRNGEIEETPGEFNTTIIENRKSCTAIMRPIKIEPPVIEKGINTSILFISNPKSKEIEFIFNSTNKVKAQIDLISNGKVVKSLMNKEIEAGVVKEKLDLSIVPAGTYSIRAVIGNRFVYKTIKFE